MPPVPSPSAIHQLITGSPGTVNRARHGSPGPIGYSVEGASPFVDHPASYGSPLNSTRSPRVYSLAGLHTRVTPVTVGLGRKAVSVVLTGPIADHGEGLAASPAAEGSTPWFAHFAS